MADAVRLEADLDGQQRPSRAHVPFPKIARLEKNMVVTEKLDGTNAAVVILPDAYGGDVWAQSRTRIISPGDDNFGFATWVAEHEEELREGLGEGVHFGEWWGRGIQRGYGLEERRFSLFNTGRWTSPFNDGVADFDEPIAHRCNEAECCFVVPVLAVREFSTAEIGFVWNDLLDRGSRAAPGFMKPEGVVVFHAGNGTLFKVSDAKVRP